MNKHQRKKQAACERFQLWIDGSSEGMFDSPRKSRLYMNINYFSGGNEEVLIGFEE